MKPRIFYLGDQSNDQHRLLKARAIVEQAGGKLDKESLVKEYLRRFKVHQFEICKKIPGMQDFEFPTYENLEDKDTALLTFLMKQQNKTLLTDRPILLDFKAPLEIDLIFLNDAQT